MTPAIDTRRAIAQPPPRAKRAAFALSAAALGAAGCHGADTLEGSPRAQIVDLVGVDPDTGEPELSLATREFDFLEDLDDLYAPEIRMRRGGAIEAREVEGAILSDGRISGAEAPGLRYAVRDGRAVARDYPTLAMLSAYYHYERVLTDAERVIGESADQLVRRFGPIDIYFEPAVRLETEDATERFAPKFNAFYVVDARQFGVAQRSEFERAPLAANALVIAHEFGHGLFELTFDEGAPRLCDPADAAAGDPVFPGRLRAEYAVAGMDEGFADFVSFAYTGGANAIAGFPAESAQERDIRDPDFDLSDITVPEGSESRELPCGGGFYCVGTLFAASLYDAFVARGDDPADPQDRGAFSRDVIAAMEGMREAIREGAADLLPPPSDEVLACARRSGDARPYDARVAAAFLAAFVPRMPAGDRGPLCDALAERFGEQGFPAGARAGCGGGS